MKIAMALHCIFIRCCIFVELTCRCCCCCCCWCHHNFVYDKFVDWIWALAQNVQCSTINHNLPNQQLPMLEMCGMKSRMSSAKNTENEMNIVCVQWFAIVICNTWCIWMQCAVLWLVRLCAPHTQNNSNLHTIDLNRLGFL